MRKLVLVGGGGHAKVLLSVIRKISQYEILGYTDPEDHGTILGVRHLGDDSVLNSILEAHSNCTAVVAVGNVRISDQRERIHKTLQKIGFDLPVIISPHAVVNEEVSLGQGTVVMDGAVVNSGSWIGECCIINTHSTVEHDCDLGDYVHVSTGAALCGGVKVGKHSLIGAGASVVQYLEIAERSIIGAGTVVYSSIVEPGTYVGNPIRKVK